MNSARFDQNLCITERAQKVVAKAPGIPGSHPRSICGT